jgi:hypothetical protein
MPRSTSLVPPRPLQAPANMNDDSDTDAPPPVQPQEVEKPGPPSHGHTQAPKPADPPRQGCHGHIITDDEESSDQSDQLEDEDLDDYGGVTAEVLSTEVSLLGLQLVFSLAHQSTIQLYSLRDLMTTNQMCMAPALWATSMSWV